MTDETWIWAVDAMQKTRKEAEQLLYEQLIKGSELKDLLQEHMTKFWVVPQKSEIQTMINTLVTKQDHLDLFKQVAPRYWDAFRNSKYEAVLNKCQN